MPAFTLLTPAWWVPCCRRTLSARQRKLYLMKGGDGGQAEGGRARGHTSSLMAFQLFAPADIAVSSYPPAQVELLPKVPGIQYTRIIAKGAEIVFHLDTDPDNRAIMARRADGTLATLYKNPSVYVGKLAGDTERLVWQEPGPSSNALQTAAWTTEPSQFAPVKVRAIPLGGYPGFVRSAYAGGWFVYWLGGEMLRAVNVSDGKYVDVPPPKGVWWVDPLGAFNGEIYATITIPPGTANKYSVARVPIAALGAPKD